jgi:hypothetical protein
MRPLPDLPEVEYDPTLPPIYDVGEVRWRQEQMGLPNFEERCVQCRGEPDGKEWLLSPRGGGKPVLLHKECWQFYRP